MDKYQAWQKKYLMNLYPCRGITLAKGNGVYLIDLDGNGYLDMMSSYGVSIFGYNHPLLTGVLQEQAGSILALHGSFCSPNRANASRRLLDRIPAIPSGHVYWSNSGAEAVEAALKFAALASKKKKFIAFQNGYHGKTLGALSATDGEKYRQPFEPLLWQFSHLPYGKIDAVSAALDTETAAVIVEPIQGESGIIPAPAGFLSDLRSLCSAKGVLLIFDEIQSGCGRTGKFLAAEHEGVGPDIVCLGKGLAGGLPIGATVVNEIIANVVPRAIHSSTFGGNPFCCAAVDCVLKLIDEKMLDHIAETGAYFLEKLRELSHPLVREVRGRGLMLGVAVNNNRDDILKLLQQKNILAIPAGHDVVRFLPPYIIDRSHVDLAVKALVEVLQSLLV